MKRAAAAVALALAALAGGCDPGTPATCDGAGPEQRSRPADEARARAASLTRDDLGPGWRAIRAEQPIDVLRPDLDGLVETGRSDSAAFVRAGLIARSTTSVFATAQDASTAEQRAAGGDYADCLGRRLKAGTPRVERSAQGVRVQLAVPRPAENGTDPVTVHMLARGRTVVLIELVGDLPAPLEVRLLARVRARLASV